MLEIKSCKLKGLPVWLVSLAIVIRLPLSVILESCIPLPRAFHFVNVFGVPDPVTLEFNALCKSVWLLSVPVMVPQATEEGVPDDGGGQQNFSLPVRL